MATTPGLNRRDRRSWADTESHWTQIAGDAKARWHRNGIPEQTRLLGIIDALHDRHSHRHRDRPASPPPS
jgi:hypothetical protein